MNLRLFKSHKIHCGILPFQNTSTDSYSVILRARLDPPWLISGPIKKCPPDTPCYWCPAAEVYLLYPCRENSCPRRLNFNKSGHNSFNTWKARGAPWAATKQWHHLLGFWRMLTGSLMHSNVNKSKLCPLPPLSGWISFYGELTGKEQLRRGSSVIHPVWKAPIKDSIL